MLGGRALTRAVRDYTLSAIVRQKMFPPRGSLAIMTYHRVLPSDSVSYARAEPGMRVAPDGFELHLRVLKKHFTPISLSHWLSIRTQRRRSQDRYAAVVFDDGWRDNHEHAFPLLKREGVPATIFLVGEAVNQNLRFWADEVADLYFSDAHRPTLRELVSLAPAVTRQCEGVLTQPSSAERLSVLIAGLKQLPDVTVENTLSRMRGGDLNVRAEAKASAQREFVNWNEVAEMGESGYVEFGSHSMSHRRLDTIHDAAQLREEVVGSKELLMRRLGKRFNGVFCYPNGSMSRDGASLVRQHYVAACTTHRGINKLDGDVFELRRFNVHADVAQSEAALLARLV